jgi:hypothetical protein
MSSSLQQHSTDSLVQMWYLLCGYRHATWCTILMSADAAPHMQSITQLNGHTGPTGWKEANTRTRHKSRQGVFYMFRCMLCCMKHATTGSIIQFVNLHLFC